MEIDFPLDRVWEAISQTITSLGWTIEAEDREAGRIKAKSKPGFMSYGSTISVEAAKVDENTTRVTATGETPVTTLTSIVDFGQTARRVDSFFRELAGQLNTDTKLKAKGKQKGKKTKNSS